MTHKDAQRATVRREFLHVEERQAMCSENLLDGEKRKIGEVFMVDGVKLILLHQSLEMRKFHGDDAVRLQKNLHTANKVINVRHLSENVIAQKQIRLFSGIRNFPSSFPSKKSYESRHTFLICHVRDVRSS